MKPLIPIFVAFGLGFTTLTHGLVAETPHHLMPNAPRTVTVSESTTPPIVRAAVLQSTLILLPAEEKVATVFGGDTVAEAAHIFRQVLANQAPAPHRAAVLANAGLALRTAGRAATVAEGVAICPV